MLCAVVRKKHTMLIEAEGIFQVPPAILDDVTFALPPQWAWYALYILLIRYVLLKYFINYEYWNYADRIMCNAPLHVSTSKLHDMKHWQIEKTLLEYAFLRYMLRTLQSNTQRKDSWPKPLIITQNQTAATVKFIKQKHFPDDIYWFKYIWIYANEQAACPHLNYNMLKPNNLWRYLNKRQIDTDTV